MKNCKILIKKFVLFLVFILFYFVGFGQTTLFSDNFTTSTGTAWDNTSYVGTSTEWLINIAAGTDFAGRIDGGLLQMTNDRSTTGNSNGWAFVWRLPSSANGFNRTLGNSTGRVSWEFNMRQIRTDPSGFSAGNYGVAFILAGSSANVFNTGNGYAVILGESGTTDPLRLVSYTTGLSGTKTNIVTSNTTGLTDFGTNYLSVRVFYTPSTNTWELFVRNDGTTAFTDPSTGTLTSQGTGVNNTYTGVSLDYQGGYWQGSTAATQTAFFDNYYHKICVSPSQPSTISGNTTICASTANTYSVTNVSGVTYTWTYSGTGTITGSGNSISLNATTTGTLTVTPSNSCGNGTARTLAITTINTAPAITTQPDATELIRCVNGTFPQLTITSSGSPTPSHQWYRNTTQSNSGGTLLSGEIAISTTPQSASIGNFYYYVTATNTCGSATSNVSANRKVVATPVITNEFNDYTIQEGEPAQLVSSSSGGTGSMTYGWRYSSDGTNFFNVVDGTPTNAVYSFDPAISTNNTLTINGLSAGTYQYRFRQNNNTLGCVSPGPIITLLVLEPTTLPVTLLSFNGICKDDNILLTWSTATEFNSDYFEILYAEDAVNWESIGNIKSSEMSTTRRDYEFKISKTGYYRLKQVDLDGGFELFNMIYVNCTNFQNNITLSPNPNNGKFTINHTSSYQVQVFDKKGKLVYLDDTNNTEFDLNFLLPGSYVIKLTNNYNILHFKFIKQLH
jgi:hypothetical protein